MEYIIIGLLVIIIILLIILLARGNTSLVERLGKVESIVVRELSTFRTDLSKSMSEDFEKLQDRVEGRLLLINDKIFEVNIVGFAITHTSCFYIELQLML